MSYRSQRCAKLGRYAQTVKRMEERMILIVKDIAKGKRTVHQEELPPYKVNENGERCWTF
jgi:hypothetical protein